MIFIFEKGVRKEVFQFRKSKGSRRDKLIRLTFENK